MRFDFPNDHDAAVAITFSFDLIDLDTGEILSKQPVFFADDSTGAYRVYVRDANGNFQANPNDQNEVLSETRHARIKFVAKVR